jgi:AP2 domain/HNH endonuclease
LKEIPLTKGQIALVDDEDYEELAKYKWCAHKIGKTYYAARNFQNVTIHMHKQIMGTPPSGYEIDHIDHPGTDNRRCNLRFATRSQNNQNQNRASHNTSGYKGVSWDSKRSKWEAYITRYGRKIHVGYFASKELAAQAYNEAAEDIFGEFARTT